MFRCSALGIRRFSPPHFSEATFPVRASTLRQSGPRPPARFDPGEVFRSSDPLSSRTISFGLFAQVSVTLIDFEGRQVRLLIPMIFASVSSARSSSAGVDFDKRISW